MEREPIKVSRTDLDSAAKTLGVLYAELIARQLLTPAEQVRWIELLKAVCIAECEGHNRGLDAVDKEWASEAETAPRGRGESADEPMIVQAGGAEATAAP